MQHATLQHTTCNKQLATKPIATAIKLATLQQNGRHHVHDACDDVVYSCLQTFLKKFYSMLDGT